MKTDIDRLHHVVKNWQHGDRGIGRTFASCHNLVGLLYTVEEGAAIWWPLPKTGWLYHIRPMVSEVLTECGLEFSWHKNTILICGTKRVLFLPDNREREFYFQGCNYYIVDTLGETADNLSRPGVRKSPPEKRQKPHPYLERGFRFELPDM